MTEQLVYYYISEICENNVLHIFYNYNDNGIDVNIALLSKRNCTVCCQQVTKAMFLSRDTRHYLFSPWNIVLLEKLTGLQVFKKFRAFYGTVLHAHVPITCRYPGRARSSPCPHIPLPEHLS